MTDKSLILFDSECLVCNRAIQLITSYDKDKRFLFGSLHHPVIEQLFPKEGSLKNTLILLESGGNKHIKSSAVFEIAKQLTFPLNILSVFRILPRFITDKLYIIFAKNRHKIAPNQTCSLAPNDQVITDSYGLERMIRQLSHGKFNS